jgi:hypothetical protein
VKLALIPPFSKLRFVGKTNYQLMLPQHVGNLTYASCYKALCQMRDQYVILDNGAAENALVPNDELLRIALEWRVDEVVAPDVLGDSNGTIKVVEEFFAEYNRIGLDNDINDLRIGIVAAGETVSQAYATVMTLMEQFGYLIKTIHIPRSLVASRDRDHDRIELAQTIYQKDPTLDIHFLGAAPVWIREIQIVARWAPFVRGMDTSAPFNYAFVGYHVDTDVEVYRPDSYFDLPREALDDDRIEYNIKVMKEWADAD